MGTSTIEIFQRFEQVAALVALIDHFRPGDKNLKAFAPHLLHENGDLHFAACLDLKMSGRLGIAEDDRYISAGLADQTLADLAGGQQFAFATSQRPVVDANLHGDRRRIDIQERQRLALFGIGDGLADKSVFKATDADDVAGCWRVSLPPWPGLRG